MILNFNEMSETVIKNFYGGEKELCAKMFVDENNKILYGKLEPGASIGLHTHEKSSEMIYILSGTGKILFEGEYFDLEEGFCHYCPVGKSHSLINHSENDLIFFAVVPNQAV